MRGDKKVQAPLNGKPSARTSSESTTTVRSSWRLISRGGRAHLIVGLDLLAATAALLRQGRTDEPVNGLEGPHPQRQELPRLHGIREPLGLVGLQDVEDGDAEADEDDEDGHDDEGDGAGQREAYPDGGDHEEADEEVRQSEPTVLSGGVAEELGSADGEAAQRPNHVPQQDSGEVEE